MIHSPDCQIVNELMWLLHFSHPAAEIEQVSSLFQEKQAELQAAVLRVEQLSLQLEDLRRGKLNGIQTALGGQVTGTAALELRKLYQELQVLCGRKKKTSSEGCYLSCLVCLTPDYADGCIYCCSESVNVFAPFLIIRFGTSWTRSKTASCSNRRSFWTSATWKWRSWTSELASCGNACTRKKLRHVKKRTSL